MRTLTLVSGVPAMWVAGPPAAPQAIPECLTLVSPQAEAIGSFGSSAVAVAVPDADGDGRGDVLIGVWGEEVSGVYIVRLASVAGQAARKVTLLR